MLTPLKQLSKDSEGGKCLSTAEVKAVNFDAFARKVCKPETPCSNDALLLTDTTNYFIEFKNIIAEQNSNLPEFHAIKLNLYEKNYSSIIILMSQCAETLSAFQNNYEYIFVYNRKKRASSKEEIRGHIRKKADTPYYPYTLDKFEGKYFKKVRCFKNPEEFDSFISGLNLS